MVAPSEPEIFHAYADVYDALYADKDYEAECDFLEEIFERVGSGDNETILDLGCGTGGHALPLARRGYKVFGIDQSSRMVETARQKALAENLADRAVFEVGDIQRINMGQSFDIALCMFAVLGYQISNEALFSTICTVRKHLREGGLFITDFWYGPAVLRQRPQERVKTVANEKGRIIRLVRSDLDTEQHVVRVNYDVIVINGDRVVEEIQESHFMRYIFRPEIDFYMNQAGFQMIHFCPFGELGKEVDERSWNVTAVSQTI